MNNNEITNCFKLICIQQHSTNATEENFLKIMISKSFAYNVLKIQLVNNQI